MCFHLSVGGNIHPILKSNISLFPPAISGLRRIHIYESDFHAHFFSYFTFLAARRENSKKEKWLRPSPHTPKSTLHRVYLCVLRLQKGDKTFTKSHSVATRFTLMDESGLFLERERSALT